MKKIVNGKYIEMTQAEIEELQAKVEESTEKTEPSIEDRLAEIEKFKTGVTEFLGKLGWR